MSHREIDKPDLKNYVSRSFGSVFFQTPLDICLYRAFFLGILEQIWTIKTILYEKSNLQSLLKCIVNFLGQEFDLLY